MQCFLQKLADKLNMHGVAAPNKGILPQNALRRDYNSKCIEWIEGHYLEVVVEV